MQTQFNCVSSRTRGAPRFPRFRRFLPTNASAFAAFLFFQLALHLFWHAFWAPPAFAGAAVDAYQKETAAYQRYYNGLSALGPQATDAQKRKLYETTVFPARMESQRVAGNIISEQEKAIRKRAYDQLKSLFVGELLPSWILAGGRSNKSSAPAGAPSAVPAASVVTESSPSVVLDGSKVPREIEFSGRPQASPSIKPSSRPARPPGR